MNGHVFAVLRGGNQFHYYTVRLIIPSKKLSIILSTPAWSVAALWRRNGSLGWHDFHYTSDRGEIISYSPVPIQVEHPVYLQATAVADSIFEKRESKKEAAAASVVRTRYKDTRHGQHFRNGSFVALKQKFISISPNLGAQCVQLDQSDCLL